jgi:hypothetical protein
VHVCVGPYTTKLAISELGAAWVCAGSEGSKPDADESDLSEPDADAFLGWAFGLTSVYAQIQQPAEGTAEQKDAEEGEEGNAGLGAAPEAPPQLTIGFETALRGPPGLLPYGIMQEVQVMVLQGQGRVFHTGKPDAEEYISHLAQTWLLQLSREELESHQLPVRKDLDFGKCATDYDVHVHYANEPLGRMLNASSIYLALISAVTGLRPDPTVRDTALYGVRWSSMR